MKKTNLTETRTLADAGDSEYSETTPGYIGDCDPKFAFSRAWKWEVEVPTPENWDGRPIPCTIMVGADDGATLSFAGASLTVPDVPGPQGGSRYTEKTDTVNVYPGRYEATLSYYNISYNPPEGNVASLNYSISLGTLQEQTPPQNYEPPPSVPCACRNSDEGGETPESAPQSRTLSESSDESSAHSSAGRGTALETNHESAHWRTDFGVFRGLGGVPAGTLEILAYEFSDALATPAALEWNHPLGSWLQLPAGGIVAGTRFKVCTGGAHTWWVCDGNGAGFFKVGASKKSVSEASWNADKTRFVLRFPDKSVLEFSASSGEVVAYRTSSGREFSAEEMSAYIDVVRDSDGVLEQVRNYWDGLANVENVSESGYEIALYAPNQVGEKDAETGRYAATGTPFKRFLVSLSESGKLTVTELDSRAGATPFPRAAWFENGAWSSSVGSGAEEIVTRRTREALSSSRGRLVTEVAFAGSSVPVSRVAEIYDSTGRGQLCLSRTEGYGTDSARTTTYEYDDLGRRIRETRPDGSVFETGYDAFGRVFALYEPWAGDGRKITYHFYEEESSANSDLKFVRVDLEKSDGSPVQLSRTDYAYVEAEEYRRVEKRTSALGAADPRLEVEETWRGSCANVHARGRVKMTQNRLGVQTHYAYAATSEYGALYTVTAETKIAGGLVNGKSTREVRFVSSDGNTTRSEKYALDEAGTWRLTTAADFEYDAQNRETKRTRGNGRVSSREMMCCGVLWEIDEDGVRTDYVYDTAQRLTEKTRALTATTPERARIFTRDAAGRVTREVLKLNSVDFSEKSAAYDILGRLVSETDELGRTTTRAYATDSAARVETETVTLPSGATRVTRTHADGTVLLEAGTSRRAVETVIDAVADGVRAVRRLAEIPAGATEPVVLSREIRNGFGETIRTEAPNTLGEMIYERRAYDARGLLVRSATDTLAPTLYEYDAFGEETKRTLALADEPTPTNSRVTATASRHENREDGVYRLVETTTYDAAGAPHVSSVATLVSESATLESKTISTDARGNATTRWTEFGEPGIRISKTQIPTATNVAQTTTNDGFAVSQLDHAGTQTTFARQFNAGANAGIVLTTTDGRGNATVVEQNVLGWTTKTTDAAGNITTTDYDLAHGKPSCVTDALGKTRRFAYDLRGNVVAEFGTGAQPVVFGYDDADAKISQKLFRVSSETIETDPRSRDDGDETLWFRDAATGLTLAKRFPDESETAYAYDALNRLSTTTLAREVAPGVRLKLTRAYAPLTGELISLASNDGDETTPPSVDETYAYDFLGRLVSVTDAAGTRALAYDAFGDPASETLSAGGKTHAVAESRDAFGRFVGYVYSKDGAAQQTVSAGYDAATGRFASAGFLHGGAEKLFSYAYLAGTDLLETLTCPNNMSANFAYEDERDLTVGIALKRGATLVAQRTYAYDALGRPTSRTLARGGATRTDSFGYNARSELTSATLGSDAYAYAFDNVGNRGTATEAGTQFAYVTNELNQYPALTKTPAEGQTQYFTPAYDADGNAVLIWTETGVWVVSYNAQNRPVSFRNDATDTLVECAYDYRGRRSTKKVTVAGTVTLHQRYIYREYLQIACVDLTRAAHPALWFVLWDPTRPTATRPLAIQKDGSWFTYGHDVTKNVWEVFGPSGYVRTSYDYAPFGAVSATGDVTQPFQWSSEFYDSELGLVYYNYRHYSPTDGRWLSRDPIEEEGGRNLYEVVGNNGIQTVDYLGEGEPSLGRHIGPDWLRKFLGIPDEDLTDWFFHRFPNSLEAAKSKMRETLASKICDSNGSTSMPNNSTQWGFGGDDFSKYGDENMSFYEKYLLMGHFSVFTKNIVVSWKSECEFSWTAKFYLEDQTGSNVPTLKDLKENTPAFVYDLFIHLSPILTYIFSPRTVVMGEWEDAGFGCCENKKENK